MKKSQHEIYNSTNLVKEKRRQKKVARLLEDHFLSRNMSNTKWRNLFILLSQSDLNLTRCNFKLVDIKDVVSTHLPKEKNLLEAKFADNFPMLNLEYYKYIEWVEIPKQYQKEPWKTFTQDVEKAFELLQKTGQFEMEITETGLKIFGYSQKTKPKLHESV